MKKILELIAEQFGPAFAACGYDMGYAKITLSNRPDLCEYQCNGAMAAAKAYKKKPIDIANEVTEKVKDCSMFSEVNAVMPGFINIKLSPEFLADYLNGMASDEELGYELGTDPETLYQDLVKELGEGNVGRGHVCAEALTCKKSGDISHWEAFRRGHVIVQDESSMLTVYALDPQPGERVLDLCAAPGGKSTHMVQRMQNQGLVESRDLYDHKLGQIRENANRLGCTILETKRSDASRAYAEDREAWDRVLLDAPCSGLGIIRNKPDLKLHRKPEDVESLAALQREMLQAAAQCVRPGGVLVYSTCTLSPRENEDNVAWFLDQHPEFVPERLEGILPAGFPPSQIHPSYTYVLPEKDFFDGFFLARFYKKR